MTEENWQERTLEQQARNDLLSRLVEEAEQEKQQAYQREQDLRKQILELKQRNNLLTKELADIAEDLRQKAKNIDKKFSTADKTPKSKTLIKAKPKPKVIEFSGFQYLRSREHFCNGKRFLIAHYMHKTTGIEFSLLPPGDFIMGGKKFECEQPKRKVHVESFLISRMVVNQKDWYAIMNDKPWQEKQCVGEGEHYPAVYISWEQAQEFCRKTDLNLPTEAQWEYACRSGTSTEYYWGNEVQPDYAWYRDNAWNQGMRHAQKPGHKMINAFGLYDMAGNIWEWCLDSWHDNYQNAPADSQAWHNDETKDKVNRGGSFMLRGVFCRSASRQKASATYSDYRLGIRPVKIIERQQK